MRVQPILTRFLAEQSDEMVSAMFESGFGHLPRKPDIVYNVRKNVVTCPLVTMRRQCDRLLSAGYDPRALRATLGYLSLYVGVRAGIVSTADPRVAHEREVQTECSANYRQLVAATTDDLKDYEVAITAALHERDALDENIAAMMARVAEKRGLESTAKQRLDGAA